MLLWCFTYNSRPYIKGGIIIKTLIKILWGIFFLAIMIVGFICPAGLILMGFIKWNSYIIIGGLIWFGISLILYFSVGDDLEEQLKEELEK